MDVHNLYDFEGVEKVVPSYPGNIKNSLCLKKSHPNLQNLLCYYAILFHALCILYQKTSVLHM